MFGIPVAKLAVIGGVGMVAFALLTHRHADASRPDPRCAYTVNADVLNVRAGPSTAEPVVGRLLQSQSVTAQPLVRNGFRQLDGTRWASADYLVAAAGAAC